MEPNINDLFTRVAFGTATYMTGSGYEEGDPTMQGHDFSAWEAAAADSAVHFAVWTKGSDGKMDRSTYTEWKGILADGVIGSLDLQAGVDRPYPATQSTVMAMLITGSWGNDLFEGLTLQHNKTGTHKDGFLASAMIQSGAVTRTKLATNAAEDDKLGFHDFTAELSGVNAGNSALATIYTLNIPASKVPGSGEYRLKVDASGSVQNNGGAFHGDLFFGLQVNNGATVTGPRQTAMNGSWFVQTSIHKILTIPAGADCTVKLLAQFGAGGYAVHGDLSALLYKKHSES